MLTIPKRFAASGLRVGRQAAMIPTFISILDKVSRACYSLRGMPTAAKCSTMHLSQRSLFLRRNCTAGVFCTLPFRRHCSPSALIAPNCCARETNNSPKPKMMQRETLVRTSVCSFQTIGTGMIARRRSVNRLNTIQLSVDGDIETVVRVTYQN